MPDLAVTNKTSDTGVSQTPEWPRPMLPLSRLWGVSPFTAMRELQEEMDQMFRGISTGAGVQAWIPTMDIQRCNGNLVVSAELPGLNKEDVRVEVSDDALVIEGERKQEHKKDHDGYHRWERNYGRFYRSVPLPEGARTDQIKAELKDGVLKVSIPVSESAKKARTVPVG